MESQDVKQAVDRALGLFLPPMVRWLLRAGVTARDVQKMLRVVYVREAQESTPDGVKQGKTNITLVSARTGLARSQVRRILKGATHKRGAAERGGHRGERVLAGWWHDRDFRDRRGRPRILNISKGPFSFAVLCGRYAGEQQQYPMILKDLETAGVVRVLPRNRVQVLRRNYAAVSWTETGMTAMFEQLAEHLETLSHNLMHPNEDDQWVCRRVVNGQVKPEYAKILVRDLTTQVNAQFETYSDTLTDPMHTASALDPDSEHIAFTSYLTRRPAAPRCPTVTEAESTAVRPSPNDGPRRRSRATAKGRR